eukprot:GEMP01075907.1.p1 GENE.GEMP01075907.1~~GEMP01075907.1.p1  ORF type:complete len:145 (-),score=7.05 GEMP01075907.1:324-758(-)
MQQKGSSIYKENKRHTRATPTHTHPRTRARGCLRLDVNNNNKKEKNTGNQIFKRPNIVLLSQIKVADTRRTRSVDKIVVLIPIRRKRPREGGGALRRMILCLLAAFILILATFILIFRDIQSITWGGRVTKDKHYCMQSWTLLL